MSSSWYVSSTCDDGSGRTSSVSSMAETTLYMSESLEPLAEKVPMRNRMKKALKKPKALKRSDDIPKNSTVTPEILSKFIAAIENGFTLKEALVQAGMNDMQYRRVLKRSDNFKRTLEIAEMKLTMAARSKVSKAIDHGDMPTVRWYLERKVPEEFRPSFGDNDFPVGLPAGSTIILPGSKPHPRIIHDDEI